MGVYGDTVVGCILPAVPNLEEDMLPSELKPWLKDISARMSVPLDFAGSAGLSMLGALIGRKIVIKPEKNSNGLNPLTYGDA